MTELAGTNDSGGSDTSANREEEQAKEKSENTATDVITPKSSESAEISKPSIADTTVDTGEIQSATSASVSGKRNNESQNTTGGAITTSGRAMGILGTNTAKRGKREWLAFRGIRQTRVGGDYQVATLPPLGGEDKSTNNENENEK